MAVERKRRLKRLVIIVDLALSSLVARCALPYRIAGVVQLGWFERGRQSILSRQSFGRFQLKRRGTWATHPIVVAVSR